MHKNILQRISSIFLLITITSAYSSIKPDWPVRYSFNDGGYDVVPEHIPIACLLTTAAACLIGTISYNLYEQYAWPNKRIINHCRTAYATIYNDIQICYNNYKGDSQASDWDLKEYITSTKTPYPFITYNEHIVVALFKLVRHKTTINDELKRISKRKKALIKNSSEESILFVEEFIQLEAKGKSLQKSIAKICTMLSALKNKIALFEEYNNDYHSWAYERQKREDRIKDNLNYLQSILARNDSKILGKLKKS